MWAAPCGRAPTTTSPREPAGISCRSSYNRWRPERQAASSVATRSGTPPAEWSSRGEAIIASELIIVLLLVLANGVFAGAELSLLTVRKTRLRELLDEGNGAAKLI